MQPNPNPSTEQQESVSIIEGLKAAGEELKRAERKSERSSPSSKQNSGQASPKKVGADKTISAASSISVVEGKTGWVSLEDYQKAILQEKQRMKEAYKEIEDLERKVREKLETIEKAETQTERINKALSELNQRIVSIKKEDDALLYQIKEKLDEK